MLLRRTKFLFVLLVTGFSSTSILALCGNTPDRFQEWISETRESALQKGIDPIVLDNALSNISYSHSTINLDRNQSVFNLSFEEFINKRGASSIIVKGKEMRAKHADFLLSIENRYGVLPGVLMALWGLESAFGKIKGKHHTLSSLATLAYDCRRSKLFTGQFFSALELISSGALDPNNCGAAHGEIGQFQFLPSNLTKFGVDADGDGRVDVVDSYADALESAANLLKNNGWDSLHGYQPGEKNFEVLRTWNLSSVYRKAIAYIASHIDEIVLQDVYR
ncbi:lytic transglycosylase domain-containing protein [Candidatus Liberibacter sp.]|uniref:lytic murein transglycosylase n=1 Tax=Candidatus Liberibacter sp. TaxID=34022 RepID=UPI0015F4E911|nr:lytic murein transglycosylase [Candidatus Liberibacter sp.]MBA5724341.1 lytic murein transglycosylase [Candidatus Liberibacter sp.]